MLHLLTPAAPRQSIEPDREDNEDNEDKEGWKSMFETPQYPHYPRYPLLIERRLISRLWGGQRITNWLGLPPPVPERLGESWEVYASNRIRNGHLRGWSLHQATRVYPQQLIGQRALERYGGSFPLLAKFIDANDRLSLQVHPDDTYAHRYEAHTGFHGKTEAWYILDARPGAEVYYGLRAGVTQADFAAAVGAGEAEDLVNRVPVQAGDVIFVPPGTPHAINEGIMIFEIQESSDLTYRLYDYNRRDPVSGELRELHLDKGLDVLQLTPLDVAKPRPVACGPAAGGNLLVACDHFALEHWQLDDPVTLASDPATMEILTVIEGTGELVWERGRLALRCGDTVVIPAMLVEWTMRPTTCGWRVLRSYVPDMAQKSSLHLTLDKTTRDLQLVAPVP